MNPTGRNIIFSAALMLALVLFLVLPGPTAPSVVAIDDLSDNTDHIFVPSILPTVWIQAPISASLILLGVKISIFASLIVYLGGRSKVRRFNDRIIESSASLINIVAQTALLLRGAVFDSVPGNLLVPKPRKQYFSGGNLP